MRGVCAFVLTLSLGWLLHPPSLSAQQDPEAQARVVFQEGLDLADHGDWATAATRFEAALALHDAPPIRFNLARCLERLGRLVDALTQLEGLEAGGRAAASVRTSAARLRADVEPRIGRIVVQLHGETAGLSAQLDARTLTAAEIDQPVRTDPGTRHVSLWRGDRRLDDVEVVVPEGGVAHVVLTAPGSVAPDVEPPVAPDLASVTPPAIEASAATHEEGHEDVAQTWWLWTIVGVVIVGAGVGIGVGVWAGSQPAGPSQTGDFMPGVVRIGG